MGQTPCHRSTIELRASNPRQGVFGPGADQSPDPTPFLVFSPRKHVVSKVHRIFIKDTSLHTMELYSRCMAITWEMNVCDEHCSKVKVSNFL